VAKRLISVHHRLGDLTGHRYPEALALATAAPKRDLDYVLFINEHASPAARAALPYGQAVLHCPVFRKDLSFDERTGDFVAMLHEHLDPVVRQDDWVLVTTATQCETRALAAWLLAIAEEKRPWAVAVFHSDRWNRYGPEERERQVGEFQVAASELAKLDADAARRLMIGAPTEELSQELSALLGTIVNRVPQVTPSDGYIAPVRKAAGGPALVGVMGGARTEKGSHLIRAIISESRRLGRVDFAVQLANEDLSAAAFEDLCLIAKEPGIWATYGPLDQATYRSFLAQCDILLLPYQRIPYRSRASAIFVEAALTGRPVVVSSGTWMGDRVAAAEAAGVTYEGDTPAEIAEALMRAVAVLPDLAARAKKIAPEWQQTMTLDVFLDWVQAEITRREAHAGDARS
jgi:hypothetical protein